MSTVDVHALGVDLALDVADPALRTLVTRLTEGLLPTGPAAAQHPTATVRTTGTGPWTTTSAVHTASSTSTDGPVVSTTLAEAVSDVLTAVNQAAVAATPHLALHCAVVGRVGVGTVVLAAGSGTGKTTLTTALLQRGWSYGSDESLVLPWAGGAPLTYPRALALSAWSATTLGVDGVPGRDEQHVRAPDLGAPLLVAGPVRHVVELRRDGHRPGLTPAPRAEAVPVLWRRGFTHHRDPGRALELLSDLVRGARCWRLDLGPPREQADALAGLLGG